ncbi:MAG: flavodoxin [Dehalococcoidia bacterium]|nr:MAG: flavodoxin [Dehalococcoidia bacterium]
MLEVVYYSMRGNTKKVAEAIAAELGVKAEDVKAKKGLAKDSFVFLGSGCYAGKPGKGLREFIARNDFKGRQMALFGTSSAGRGDEVKVMEELLKPTGALIRGSFYCKGRFLCLNRKHPSDEELAKAKEFAKEMKGS